MSVTFERPSYYDDFKCIADKCDFTCCRDWTIAVDDETYKSWKNKCMPDSMVNDKNGISLDLNLTTFVETQDESKRIVLEDGKCPFLDCNGLCHIVRQYGEECLSKTCHTYPRENIHFADIELRNLTLSCKTAVAHLFNQSAFHVISEFNERGATNSDEECPSYLIDLQHFFYKLIEKYSDISSADILKTVFYIILDLIDQQDDEASDINNTDGKLAAMLDLYKKDETILSIINTITDPDNQTDSLDRFIEDNELLMDLFLRYYEQGKYSEFIKPVFEKAKELEELIEDGVAIELYEKYLSDIGDRYEDKIRLIVAEELWSSLIVSYYDIETVAVKVEWLAIELALLKHYMFIHYTIYGHLTEEELISIVAVLFRTTGYCDDDIIEYLSDCFEDIIWEWGYMDLII